MAIQGLNSEWITQEKGKIPQAKVDWVIHKRLDLPYGQHPLQRLDLYLPDAGSGPFPVVVNVHGGGFVHCDKRDFHLYPTFYALLRGYAVVAVNYRLSPGARYPAQVQDVADALKYLGQEGEGLGLDTRRVFLWGTSAGGNIVLHLACAQGLVPRKDACRLLGTAAFCPLTSLDTLKVKGGLMAQLRAGLMLRYMVRSMFGTLRPSPEQRAQVDVGRYLSGGLCPIYLQHGENDPALPIAAAREFAGRLAGVLPEGSLVFDELKGARHAGDGADFFLPQHIHPVLDFFDRLQGKP